MADHRMTETVPVRVTKKRYKELRRLAKANGHTISWLLNYAIDLYFQSIEPAPTPVSSTKS
jgi:predicted DNA-binding protein